MNYVDKNGLYYIKEEVTFSPDMDPRNPNYCKPTGRYYVVPETVLSATKSVALSALPFGDHCFWYIDFYQDLYNNYVFSL